MKRLALGILLIAVALPLSARIGLESGPKLGSELNAFEPTHVTGPDANTNTCPVCKYGPTPAVQVWVNGDSMGNVVKLAKKLESEIGTAGADKLKTFFVFVRPADKSEGEFRSFLAALSERAKLKNVAFTYLDRNSEAVQQYQINTAPDVKNTVLVYTGRKVKSNFVNLEANEEGLDKLHASVQKIVS